MFLKILIIVFANHHSYLVLSPQTMRGLMLSMVTLISLSFFPEYEVYCLNITISNVREAILFPMLLMETTPCYYLRHFFCYKNCYLSCYYYYYFDHYLYDCKFHLLALMHLCILQISRVNLIMQIQET